MLFNKTLLLQLLFFPFAINAAITVYVSTYKVRNEGDASHWAIFLDGERRVILQLGDEKVGNGYFIAAPIYDKSPTRARRHKKSYFVGKINSNSRFNSAIATIQSTPINSDSSTWNCQAWTIEALDRLEESGVFKWEEGQKETLQEIRQYWQ
ncbi:hypothetical protein CTRI78_v009145 [Colletotrichum trifolii]|uniref:Uncharacterized protein n=1 Tax=Colletotrichum trifolii TaxID=5466 RepID=A0A4R8QRF8_COLTR|nr:hypothetical protein CTRI78_v009145 [Colletotrichum trifolii]